MSRSQQVSFRGEGGAVFGIVILNFLLALVTLGIYTFWGRTNLRRYWWSVTEFAGDRFAYHGTGKELLFGYMKALGLFAAMILLLAGMSALFDQSSRATVIMMLAFWFGILTFIPVALVGARRYRLTRTSWRNIRFSLRGDTVEFVKLYWFGMLLSIVTLGFYTPFFQNSIREYFTEHTYFGTEPFTYDGTGRDLFPHFLLAILLTIPTLGLYWIWYNAARHRYYWSHTTFAGVPFQSTITGGGLFGLWLTNLLLLFVTFGIAAPWVFVRHTRFMLEHISLEGEVDFARIEQEAQSASATGDALSEVFDVGGAWDVGI